MVKVSPWSYVAIGPNDNTFSHRGSFDVLPVMPEHVQPETPSEQSNVADAPTPREVSTTGMDERDRKHRLATSTIWSLIGYTLPFPAALIAIPILTHALGADRFGVMSLAWALIGYSSIFDLGLGPALTKVVSERRELDPATLPALVWSTLALLVVFGAVSAVVIMLAAAPLVDAVFNVPPQLRAEATRSFQIMALSLPFITVSAGMRGLLEAHQDFRTVGFMNSFTWSLMFLAPLLALPFSHSVIAAMVALVLARIGACILYGWLCFRRMPTLRLTGLPGLASAAPALRFGGWLTVSNIVGPFLTYFDRFVIGTLLTVSAVTFYTVPYDMVLRLTVVGSAVTSVLFPTFSALFARDRAAIAPAYLWGLRTVALIAAPLALGVLLLAPEGLLLWLGPTFASQSAPLLRWLTVGVFISCLVQVPFALIQASGRPDLTAKLHLLELVPYLALLWLLVGKAGITGAALAWTSRVTLDAVLILLVGRWVFPEGKAASVGIGAAMGIAWVAGVVFQAPFPLSARLVFLVGFGLIYTLVVWRYGLTDDEKLRLLSFPSTLRSRVSQLS